MIASGTISVKTSIYSTCLVNRVSFIWQPTKAHLRVNDLTTIENFGNPNKAALLLLAPRARTVCYCFDDIQLYVPQTVICEKSSLAVLSIVTLGASWGTLDLFTVF